MQTRADASDNCARAPAKVVWLPSNNEVLAAQCRAKRGELALDKTDSMRLYEKQHPDRHDGKSDHNPNV